MLKNYLKITFRNLGKQKLYSFINIMGLALGLGFCILVLLYVNDELTYDRFHADADRIYRLYRQPTVEDSPIDLELAMPLPTGEAMVNDFPAVDAYVRFITFGTQDVRHDGSFYEQGEVVFSDPSIFSVFTFPLKWGDPATALVNPNSTVLTPEAARKYFGGENPVGRTLEVRLNGEYQIFTVTGVTEPIPSNSTIRFQMLLPNRMLFDAFDRYGGAVNRWDATRAITYVRLREGSSVEQVRSRLPEFMENHLGGLFDEMREDGNLAMTGVPIIYQFQPLTDVHMNPDIPGGFTTPASPRNSYILGGIAIAVLLIACINFMILAIGRSAGRGKEVGMRKVAGAGRGQLMMQFWGEAMLMTFIAFALGIGLAEGLLPLFNELSGKELSLATLSGYPTALAILGGIFLITGLIAGSYPAIVLSAFRPIESLKERIKGGGYNQFTRSLIVVQFAISVFLISGTLIMSHQLKFVQEINLGFQGEQVVVVPLPGLDAERVMNIYREEFSGDPDIQKVSGVSYAFDRGTARRGFRYEGELKQVAVFRVDPEFIETMEMDLLLGRDFNPELASDSTASMIVNEAFLREFGWREDPVDRSLDIDWGELKNPRAIGVVRDFHFQSLRNEVQPAMLYTSSVDEIGNMLVRISPQKMSDNIEKLRGVWSRITNEIPFSFRFLDDGMDSLYRTEERWSRIVSYGSFFAIFVACMGLFGLAGIMSVRRRKEVGIRKVLGASVSSVTLLLSKDFARLVLIAIVLAAPAAYWVMQNWLQNFAYRIEAGPGLFILAGGIVLAVALLTVARQAIRAALANPVDSLRTE